VRVTHRLSVFALGGAAALLPAAPSHALGIGGATATPSDDAQMCFSMYSTGVMVGTATATGAVHTVSSVPGALTTLPNTLVADARPLASTTGYTSVCVGGTGKSVDAGTVLFTFDVHGASGDFVDEELCTYSPSGPSCN
jgi:hypothetical protein